MATPQGVSESENTVLLQKYDWDLTGGICYCFPSKKSKCLVTNFWEVQDLSPFFDSELSQLTTNIKSLLGRVAHNPDGKSHLSFIIVVGSPFLVWTEPTSSRPQGGIGSDDNPTHLVQSLKLQLLDREIDPTTRAWYLSSDGIMHCFKNEADSCRVIVKQLWQAAQLTSWHTEELARATREMQNLINEVAERNKNPNRHLAMLSYDHRPLLAWVQHDGVSADDDVDTVVRALRLKTR